MTEPKTETEPAAHEPELRCPRIHELKTLEPYFDDVAAGRKTFEVRLNDRNFALDDILLLRRVTKTQKGKTVLGDETLLAMVTYVLDAEKVMPVADFVVMGIRQVFYAECNGHVGALAYGLTHLVQLFGGLPEFRIRLLKNIIVVSMMDTGDPFEATVRISEESLPLRQWAPVSAAPHIVMRSGPLELQQTTWPWTSDAVASVARYLTQAHAAHAALQGRQA